MATARDYKRVAPAGDYEPGPDPGDAIGTRNGQEGTADRSEPQRRAAKNRVDGRTAKNRVDEWMEGRIKLGGTGVKRKTASLILLGAWGFLPLFFMLPSLLTFNTNTIGNSVDDTLGTGAMVNLFLCLLVSPTVTLTGQRWFVPLRRWFGIMFACCGIGDALGAAFFDDFAGNPFAKLVEHTFTLLGFLMVMLAIPLLITGNNWAQRKLGRYWKKLHKLIYVIWGLLLFHLITLEGFGFERGSNGSGFAGDGDPIFHQRLYQYCACSLFLLTLRLPPVKGWIAARQQEGRNRLVYLTVMPIFVLFLFGFVFIVNELILKGTHSFVENPSHE